MFVSEVGAGCVLAGLLVLTSVTLPDYPFISATVRAHVEFDSVADFLLGNAKEFPGLFGFLSVFMKSKGLRVPITVGVLGGILAVGGDCVFGCGVKWRRVWLLLWGRMVAEAGHLMLWFMAFPILALTIYSPQQASLIFTVVACERCFVPTLAYYWHYWLYAKLGNNLADTLLYNSLLRTFFPVLIVICCWYVYSLDGHREAMHDGTHPETTTAKKLRSICLMSALRSQLVCPLSYWLMMAIIVVFTAVEGSFSELVVFSRVYNDSPASVATEVAFGRGVAGIVCFLFTFLYIRRVNLENRARLHGQVLTCAVLLRWLGFLGVWLRVTQSGQNVLVHEQLWVQAFLNLGQILFDMWASQHLICLAGSGVAAASGLGLLSTLSSVMTLLMGWVQVLVYNSLGIRWLTGLYAAIFFLLLLFTVTVWLLTPTTYPGTLTAVPGIASSDESSSFEPSPVSPRALQLSHKVLLAMERLGPADPTNLDEDPATLVQQCFDSLPSSQRERRAGSSSAPESFSAARNTHRHPSINC